MEYTYSATPLVVVAGTPGADASGKWRACQPLDEIPLLPSAADVVDLPVAAEIRAKLAEVSQTIGPWDPLVAREERLHFHFANTMEVAAKEPKPSVLSPSNKDSPQSQPIFTHEWLRKYFYFMPIAAVVVVHAPIGEDAETNLVDDINELKSRLSQYGTQLVVLVVGKDGDLMNVVPFLRRQTGLPAKTGMFGVADDFNPQEINNLVSSLYQTLLTKSQEFFATKMRDLREKRKAVAPPQDLLVWDARFTLKLAFCSEFKGDNSGALKLYESAYDSLSLLFENRAITVESDAYRNAREVMDVVAIKIFQCALPLRSAFTKFRIHLSTVERLLSANSLSCNSKSALFWRATQYARFAQLCSIVKQTSAPNLGDTGGMPPGLIWLDAAKLFVAKVDPDAAEDPYQIADEETLTAQQAFLNAISDLSGMSRAKAYALAAYGDWLSSSDASAAQEAYKTAVKSLPEPVWPGVQRYLSRKLNDGVALFTLGESTELPKDVKTADQPFFKVTGTFETPDTYIGREIKAQITLEPLFPGNLELERLRVRHSLGQIDYKKNAEKSQERLVKGNDALLHFSDRAPITFEFGITALEPGDVELVEIEFIAGNEFTQRLPIKPSGEWLDALPVSPRTIRHLPLCDDFCKIHVDTRPAKLKIEDNTTKTAAAGEQLLFSLKIRSDEAEVIEPEVSVTIGEDTILHKQLDALNPGDETVVEGSFEAPALLFQLVTRIKYNTATDTLPVTKHHVHEIDIARPFRVNFDLMPVLLEQEWPAFFAPTLTLPQISRKWRLRTSILSLFAAADVVLQKSRISLECEAAEFEIENVENEINEEMKYNSHARTAHAFVIRRKSAAPAAAASARNLEAFAHLELTWCRKSSPGTVNVFNLAPVRLNLPTQEPRVLAVADKRGDDTAMSQVSYHVENASARTLNFSVSMASSTFFAFQGPKFAMLRMLPFSTRILKYQLVPLGEGAVQNRRPLPELRVYDVNYKRTLAVLSGDEHVRLEQGTLFV